MLFEQKDIKLLMYILHLYVLNNSLDKETLLRIINNLRENLSESDIAEQNYPRLAVLGRSLKQIINKADSGMEINNEIRDFEKMVSAMVVAKYEKTEGKKSESTDDGK